MLLTENYVSLYDYLGKPAEPGVGKDIMEQAIKGEVIYAIKQINNSKYKGGIAMYPESFLKRMFSPQTKSIQENDDLPF